MSKEISFSEFVLNGGGEDFWLSLQFIGLIPTNAQQNLDLTMEYKNITKAQKFALSQVDFFWYRIVYWVSYYRLGNMDKRKAPLGLKVFKDVEPFGELYAQQLDLTIRLCDLVGVPEPFKTPLEWWREQMLELKQDAYYSIFYPYNPQPSKTKAVERLKSAYTFMRDWDGVKPSDNLPLSTQTLVLLNKSKQLVHGRSNKHKKLNSTYREYLAIFKRIIEIRRQQHQVFAPSSDDSFLISNNKKNRTFKLN